MHSLGRGDQHRDYDSTGAGEAIGISTLVTGFALSCD